MVNDQAGLPNFDVEQVVRELHAEASHRTGLTDFGSDTYRQPFAMLASHIASGQLSEIGLNTFREDLIVALVGRLVREEQWKQHPEYSQRAIIRPIVICGVPRTGTTALHKLLSVDPQFQGLDNWLTSWPVPRPPREEWNENLGYRNACARLEKFFDLIPEMRISHEMVAEEVDECLQLLRLDFVSYNYPASYDLPEYEAWFQSQDAIPFYRQLADTLRLIGLRDDRTWLLKNPSHIAELAALLNTFPDARVIITHRDPLKALPSLCSVLASGRRIFYRNPDLKQIGPPTAAYWGSAQNRADDVRKIRPKHQFIDVEHSDFHNDPMSVVRRIYTHFELELLNDVEQAMQSWLSANPAGKHGQHSYELEDYGLCEEQLLIAMTQ